MGNHSDKSLELEDLLFRVLCEQASGDELAALNQSLSDSAELRSQACEFLLDDALIAELSVTRKQADSLVERLTSSCQHVQDAKPRGFAHRAWRYVNHHGMAVGTIATMLVIALCDL